MKINGGRPVRSMVPLILVPAYAYALGFFFAASPPPGVAAFAELPSFSGQWAVASVRAADWAPGGPLQAVFSPPAAPVPSPREVEEAVPLVSPTLSKAGGGL